MFFSFEKTHLDTGLNCILKTAPKISSKDIFPPFKCWTYRFKPNKEIFFLSFSHWTKNLHQVLNAGKHVCLCYHGFGFSLWLAENVPRNFLANHYAQWCQLRELLSEKVGHLEFYSSENHIMGYPGSKCIHAVGINLILAKRHIIIFLSDKLQTEKKDTKVKKVLKF